MKRAITSASNIYRRALCPGSARMEAKYGSGEESEWSKEGTLLHSLFMRPDCTQEERGNLNDDQSDALLSAEELTMEFINSVREQFGIHEDWPTQMLHEVELTFYGTNREPLFPGHADLIVNSAKGRLRIITDAKMGFMDVEQAADNYQLCTYAVMAQQRDPVDVCAVQIVQPRNFGPKQSSAIYSAETLAAAERTIEWVFLASEKPDASLNPSATACHFCSAKAACHAYKEKFAQLEPLRSRAIETLDLEQLGTLKEICSRAKKLEPEVNGRLIELIETGKAPGWKLKNNGSEREITDPLGFFSAVYDHFTGNENFSAGKYDACRDIVWSRLEALVKECQPDWTKKRVKEFVKQISEPYVTETEKAKSPVKIKQP